MKSLVLIPNSINSPEFEILLSKSQEILDKKIELTILTCSGYKNSACELNPFSDKIICKICKDQKKEAFRKLQGKFQIIEVAPHKYFSISKIKKLIKNYENLRNLNINNIDIGLASFSSYISITRDVKLEGYLAANSILDILNLSYSFYYAAIDLDKKKKFKNLICYNGRMGIQRPIFRYFEKTKRSLVLEYAGARLIARENGIFEFNNHLPTDRLRMHKLILKTWANRNKNDRKYIDQFFKFKKKGAVLNDKKAYVRDQGFKKLPYNWNKNSRNIVIFSSSDDEYTTLGKDYDKSIYPSQTDGILKIVEDFKKLKLENTKLWIRIHPNTADIFWNYGKKIKKIQLNPDTNIILPKSKVSTYEMLDKCDLSICFASVVAVEAVFWKKPSVVLSKRIYDQLPDFYTPKSHKEVMKIISNNNIKPKKQLSALKYANFWTNNGKKLKYFQCGPDYFLFNNKKIHNNFFYNTLYKLFKFKQVYFNNYIKNYLFSFLIK